MLAWALNLDFAGGTADEGGDAAIALRIPGIPSIPSIPTIGWSLAWKT